MLSMKAMPYHSGITVRIYPSPKQKQIIAVNSGASRAVYNCLVAYNKELWQLKQYVSILPWYGDRIDYLSFVLSETSGLRHAMPYLNNESIDGIMIANAKLNYQDAWKNHKIHPEQFGIPTFHKKSYDISYQTNAVYQPADKGLFAGSIRFLDEKHMQLPKLGRIRFKGSDSRIADLLSRIAETRIGTVTVGCRANGEYYISMQLGSVEPFVLPLSKTGSVIGIDVNVDNYYTDSNGNVVPNPAFYRNSEKKLIKAQKKLSRMAVAAKKDNRSIYDSKNYQKQRLKLSKITSNIQRQREQYAHIQSSNIVKNHDLIVVEDIKTKNIMKNHNIAKSVADVSWYQFTNMLEYKSLLYDKNFVKVPPHNTTQTCSACGFILKGKNKLTLKDREWMCPKCKTHHIRDHNAAINILNKGLATFVS